MSTIKNKRLAVAAVARMQKTADGLEGKARARWRGYVREARRLLADMEASGLPRRIDIRVEWKRSRTWGNCPRVDLTCSDTAGEYHNVGGYASGCGYDKLSAAIVEALDRCAPVRRLLVENWGRAARLARKIQAEIKTGRRWVNSEYNGCGLVPSCYHGDRLPGFGAVSGCGWSSVREVLEFLGLRAIIEDRCGRRSDWFVLEAVKGKGAR